MKKFLVTAVSLCTMMHVFAQNNYWQRTDEKQVPAATIAEREIKTKAGSAQKLNFQLLKTYLNAVPDEGISTARNNSFILELPMPDGSTQKFKVWKSTLMSPELQKQFPEIKAYRGEGITDRTATFCADLGPNGFHAMIINENGSVFIDPYSQKNNNFYQVYFKKDFDPGNRTSFKCGFKDEPVAAQNFNGTGKPQQRSNGLQLKTFRLAVACTGEYGSFFVNPANQIITTMNRVNEIYRRDLSISLVMVNNAGIIFRDPATDRYTNNGDEGTISDENQGVVDDIIGSANYDIGHVFSQGVGGGVAYFGVCNNNLKADAATLNDNPVGDPFAIDYVAHEMGHQFHSNHSFNICGSGDTYANGSDRNRITNTAYEPGSGVTIMGYAGICNVGNNVANNSIAMFHSTSYDQILDFVQSNAGACGVNSNSGNTPPVVAVLAGGFSIPKGTPFTLTGNAADVNNNPITYSWEQIDLGPRRINTNTSTSGPNFRTFLPVASSTRTFPSIDKVVANNLIDWTEVIYNSNTDRNFNFRLVARDGQGGVDYEAMQFTVKGNAGPLLVTAPNTNVSWAAGSQQTVSWNVNNTNAAPINADNVRITLSTNGGTTYPITILASTPNDGLQLITVPNNVTNQARIRVEFVGANYSFFDISNVNFSITAGGGGQVNYCASNGGTAYEHISRVQYGTINNTSGNNNGYGNFTAQSTNITRGVAANITLTPGFASGAYNEAWNVYIDYNRDGDFADAGEMAASGSGSGAITLSITPPAAASVGSTRMRVIMQYNTLRNNPCGSFAEGEVEDYSVNIASAARSGNNTPANVYSSLTILPNPAKDVVVINAASGTVIKSIKLVDIAGRTVLSARVTGDRNTINLSKLSAGNYFVHIELSNGDKEVRSIVKQ